MRERWEVKTLGKVSDFQGGSQPPKSQFLNEQTEGYIRLLQIRDFKSDSRAVYIPEAAKNRICSKNDIMIGRYGASVGQIHRGKSGAYNVALIKTLPDETIIDKDFFYHYLVSDLFQKPLSSVAERSAQAGFSKADIFPFEIPVPPLAEQKRIVAVLDEAFEGIAVALANTEKNLANARELFETTLNATFTQKGKGWVERAMSDVCSISSKLVDPKEPAHLDLPHLGAGNMVSKTGEIIDIKTAREEGLISGKFIFDADTILYSKIRPYLMKACRPDFVGLCSADVYPLSINKDFLIKDYLFHLLMSDDFTKYAIAGSSRAGMPKVNRKHLFAYRLWVPSVLKQQELVSGLDMLMVETQRLESLYHQKIDALTELRQSLLQKAFAGELTADMANAKVTKAVA